MGLYDNLVGNNPTLQGQVSMNDVALIDNTIPNTLFGLITGRGTARGVQTIKEFAPYIKDIWEGRELLFHKPFNWMSREEFKNYGKLGKSYYQNHLQKNPVFVEGHGEVSFGGTNNGKDNTINMEQYPLLRKNMENYQFRRLKPTNNKNEKDRVYHHIYNNYKGDLYDYLIEDIKGYGKRYKMMHNKTKGE